MSFLRLLLTNLAYHRRGNFAVFLGVALGTAVLTGALLVGDSLRGSLRDLTLEQLGWIDEALVANRFFRARLADQLPAKRSAAALLLQGSAFRADDTRPIPKVTVLGVDARFWPEDQMPEDAAFWKSDAREVVLNQSLAEALEVKVGDKIDLNVQSANDIPREILLGKRKQQDVVQGLYDVKVRAILPDRGMARFTLRPTPEPVRNAFLPRAYVQNALSLGDRANAVLVAGAKSPLAPELRKHLTLADWNLKLRAPEDRARALVKLLDPRNDDGTLVEEKWTGRVPDELAKQADDKSNLHMAAILRFYRQHRGYFLLESNQHLLEDAVVKAAHDAVGAGPGHIGKIGDQRWWVQPTLIYLADSMALGSEQVSYAVVAAQGPQAQEKDIPPQGNQIDLAHVAAAKLKAKPGDSIKLSYYAPDEQHRLRKTHETFVVRKVFPLEGRFDDPDLVPEFPGITDRLTVAGWASPPFPYDDVRGKTAESYWKRYRTTPQAYISLEKAQQLWGSRFGKLTSIRFLPMTDTPDFPAALATFQTTLLANLDPQQGGFVFQDVRSQGLVAAGAGTDFGVLFLAFSFFLIVAALLLVGLLFRLNLDRRGPEIGVLLATGWTHRQVRWLLLGEGFLVALAGSLVGLAGALVYGDRLLAHLNSDWPGQQKLDFLRLHVTPTSLAIGLVASLAISFLTILWATRILSKMAPRALLAGETTASALVETGPGRRPWSLWIAAGSLLGAVLCLGLGMTVEGHEAQAGSFFGSGALVLTAGLAATWRILRTGARHSNPRQSLAGLGMRNAGRHAVRSVLTVGLLGAATFLIVAVEAFHKEAGKEFAKPTGGSGGFPLVGQSDVPLYEDLNDPAVRKRLIPAKDRPLLDKAHIVSCRVHAGDDASCLNLYQPQRPRIVGVPRSLIDRGGFAFAASLATTDAEKKNPWLLLEQDGPALPVFASKNTSEWALKVPLGGALDALDDRGQKVTLRIVGLLDESIFQSELVMAESHFRKAFPRQQGSSYFLIDCPPEDADTVKIALETALAANGLAIEPSIIRLQRYLEVENTYLSTFQALGRLGLILGAVGLAIVLLRGVWERRSELALLRALGFRPIRLALLVLAENVFLLVAGLAVGVVAALLAVAPHLAGSDANLLWLRVAALLGVVLLVGIAAGLAAVAASIRGPLIQALRRE